MAMNNPALLIWVSLAGIGDSCPFILLVLLEGTALCLWLAVILTHGFYIKMNFIEGSPYSLFPKSFPCREPRRVHAHKRQPFIYSACSTARKVSFLDCKLFLGPSRNLVESLIKAARLKDRYRCKWLTGQDLHSEGASIASSTRHHRNFVIGL